jgi:lipopolysaccharide biosynthesis glycosyltransferase
MKIYIGYDPREEDAYRVAERSAGCQTIPLVQSELRYRGFYTRPIDPLSSTEFSFTRFLVPFLNNYEGWALFVDCDVLFLEAPEKLFDLADDKYAVMCVKHDYAPTAKTKMDGQAQHLYPRKNWSSVMLFNCKHPSNRALTPNVVNSESGSFLHQMKWLKDEEIGELPKEWNWLVGWYKEPEDGSPKLLHYTEGGPWFSGYEDCEYSEIWKSINGKIHDRI